MTWDMGMCNSDEDSTSMNNLSLSPEELREKATNDVLRHDYTKGPLLLIAGPGTGKTFNILETIKEQLKRYTLDDFYVGSLTNATVRDFENEAKQTVHSSFQSVSTLHFRAKGIVHKYADTIMWPKDFRVLENSETKRLLSEIQSELQFRGNKIHIRDLEKIALAQYREKAASLSEDNSEFSILYAGLQRFYRAMDWADLIRYACQVLNANEDALAAETDRVQFILIDEYQDLNRADQEVIRLLIDNRQTLMVVGDPNQSIYSGRFADPTGITRFHEIYPSAEMTTLPVCSRCPSKVLNAAFSLISNNDDCLDTAPLVPMPNTEERTYKGLVHSVRLPGSKKEAEFIATALIRLQHCGVPYNKVLVLVSSSKLGKKLFDQVHEADNELRIQNCLGNKPDQENPIDYLLAFLSDHNDNLALRMMLDQIAEVKADKVNAVRKYAYKNKISLWQALCSNETGILLKRSKSKTEQLITIASEVQGLNDEEALDRFLLTYPKLDSSIQIWREQRISEDNNEKWTPKFGHGDKCNPAVI